MNTYNSKNNNNDDNNRADWTTTEVTYNFLYSISYLNKSTIRVSEYVLCSLHKRYASFHHSNHRPKWHTCITGIGY